MTTFPVAPDAEPSEAEAREALARVLAQPRFQASARASDFLAYVVDETLAGRGQELSERRVGRYGLGLTTEAGALDSSLVRVHATRVRKMLESYYESAGAADPVRLILPTGHYSVRFQRHRSRAFDPVGPRVLVTCLRDTPENQSQPPRSCHLVGSELRRFPGVQVVVSTAGAQENPASEEPDYILSSRVGADGRHVSATLIHRTTGDLLWSSSDDVDLATPETDSDDEWAARVAARVGDYSGALLRHHIHHPPVAPSPIQVALVAFCTYVEQSSPESTTAALDAVDSALKAGARSPVLLAMRASMLMVVASMDAQRTEELLDEAQSAAREAIQLDPTLGHAHIALASSSMLKGDRDLSVQQAEEAIRMSPHHPVLLASAGTVFAAAGHWTAAAQAVDRAFELNPALPPYAHTISAFARLLAGDDAGALAAASKIRAPGQIWGPLYRALALDGLGQRARAKRELAEAVALVPDLAADPQSFADALVQWQPEARELLSSRLIRLAQEPHA